MTNQCVSEGRTGLTWKVQVGAGYYRGKFLVRGTADSGHDTFFQVLDTRAEADAVMAYQVYLLEKYS